MSCQTSIISSSSKGSLELRTAVASPCASKISLPNIPTVKANGKALPEDQGVKIDLKPPYEGSGSYSDPYIVDFLPNDHTNPYNWAKGYRWVLTMLIGVTTLCPPFASVSYSSTTSDIMNAFNISKELAIAGVSLFIVGFGLGPLLWAPISEIYGRNVAFYASNPLFALFNLGTALSNNVVALLVTRFFAGFCGASTITNAGGQVGDMWAVHERALATSVFALAPFLGPVLGPVVGGYVTEECGYRWVYWIQFIYAVVMCVLSTFIIPETYAPTILRRTARNLQAVAFEAGKEEFYLSKYDRERKSKKMIIVVGLYRPFEMLFTELIVGCLSLYGALIYGILYLFFTAFPIVFQQDRGWTVGESGLSFIGMGVGLVGGVMINPFLQGYFYKRAKRTSTGNPAPECRLIVCCVGAVLAPVGLIWFAWTSAEPVHWAVPIVACVPFGLAFLLIFTSMTNYLIDSYTLFSASAMAAQAVSRCCFGAIFPLFATQMYTNMGLHWAGTLVAAFSLLCAPMPFLFYFYGSFLRRKSRYAPSTPLTEKEEAETPEERAQAERDSLRKIPTTEVHGLEPEWAVDAGESAKDGSVWRGGDQWDVEKGR